MRRGLVSIALFFPILHGCAKHSNKAAAQTKQESAHITSLPPAGSVDPAQVTRVGSEPQTLDRSDVSRPSPFAVDPESEVQHSVLLQTSPAALAPSAAVQPIRGKPALKLESDRKPLKTFIPRTSDESRSRVALLPQPPALPAITQSPASSHILSYKTCCVGTATAEPARPALVRRVLGRVPGLRRIRQSPANTDGYVAPRPVREISLVLPPAARAALPQGTMDLKATVNEVGHVTRVQLLSPKDEELVRLAAYAAGSWPFVPAKINDEAVPGEVILHFTFSGN
jgi:outer membrane biosynthesis protein TonB